MKFYTDVFIHNGKICCSSYENGEKKFIKKNYCPELYILTNKNTGFKDIFNENLEPIGFNSISEYNQYKKNYKDTLDLYGDISPIYQFINEKFPKKIKFNISDIRIFLYDIEVINIYNDSKLKGFPQPQNAEVPIVGITIKDLKSKTIWVLSLVDYDPKKTKLELDGDVKFKKFNTEEELLIATIKIFEKFRPDILLGWYNKNFDDSYLIHRMLKILPENIVKKLSPVGYVDVSFNENKAGKIEPKTVIKGLQILDYIELYKKFIPAGRESYSLNFISSYELGEEKIKYQDFDNLKDFYLNDPQNATDYNIYDVELIDLLEKKLGLISLAITIAYKAKINYEDIFSPLKTWDVIIFNELKEKNIIIPPHKYNLKENYPGAFVLEPTPGIYDWVMTFDLASLYPHCIMQYNISPETIVNKTEDVNQKEIDKRFLNKEINIDKNLILSGSGQYFRKDKRGFLPILMEQFYNERKIIKKQMLKNKQKYEEINEELKKRGIL